MKTILLKSRIRIPGKIVKKNHRTDRNQCDGKKESSNEAKCEVI